MVVNDPVRHRQFALKPGAQRLLHRFADWTSVPEPDVLTLQLLGEDVLVAEGSTEHMFGQNLGVWEEWGTATTYYHLATRNRSDEKFSTAAENTA